MRILETPVLNGREVTLRPMSVGDADGLAAAASESRAQYGLTFVPEGRDATLAYIEKLLRLREAGTRLPLVTVWRDRVVGSTSFLEPRIWEWPAGSDRQRTDRPDTVEIGGTWLAASAQRTRCNTEAKLLMLGHAFERWEVHGVSFKTDARNDRSRRAIERLGARFDGVLRAHMPASDGAVRDSAYYSILASEWPAIKAALERGLASR